MSLPAKISTCNLLGQVMTLRDTLFEEPLVSQAFYCGRAPHSKCTEDTQASHWGKKEHVGKAYLTSGQSKSSCRQFHRLLSIE